MKYVLVVQFGCNVDRLYKEKITQVIAKLKEVESGVASEYLNPLAQLEDNRRIRITVAGNARRSHMLMLSFSLQLKDELIMPLEKVHDLGIIIDGELNMDAHARNVVRSCFYQLQ